MTTSDNADGVLARVAKRNNGEPITFQALSEWLSSGECRRSVMETAAWSILELSTNDEDWDNYTVLSEGQEGHQSPKKKGKDKPPRKPRAELPEGSFLPLKGPRTRAEVALDAPNEQVIATFNGAMVSPLGHILDDKSCSISLNVSELLTLWNNLPLDDRPGDGFPLARIHRWEA